MAVRAADVTRLPPKYHWKVVGSSPFITQVNVTLAPVSNTVDGEGAVEIPGVYVIKSDIEKHYCQLHYPLKYIKYFLNSRTIYTIYTS